MMKIPESDFQKLADDFKRISEAFDIVKNHPDKTDKLFETAMDLLSRELDRLYLDIIQITK